MFGLPVELQQALVLAVPGFVAIKVYGLLVPSRRVDTGSAILEVLAYGALNFCAWFWLYREVVKFPRWEQAPWWAALLAFAAVFISPCVLAVLTWRFRQSRRAQRWLSSPSPTAWDFFFSQRKPCWMLFKLRNGVQFGGYFGPQSYATTHPEARDLYVEDLWRVDEHGRFTSRVEGNFGAVIRFDECQELQFFRTEESNG